MITGGIKYFEPSQNLMVNGASITASSGNAAAQYAIDRNEFTYWQSVSSNDATTETVTVTFPATISINRLLCLDINWKQFQVKYNVTGTWTNFTSVVGLDGALGGGISETTFADNTAYYEFAQVTTDKIQFTIDKTQVVDADKYVAQIIATTEIGTFKGFPKVKSVDITRNERSKQTLSGRYVVQKSDSSTGIQLNFANYSPRTDFANDLDIMMSLFDRDKPFIVWLCGGKRGTSSFGYTLRGFRLLDALTMQITKGYSLNYDQGVYVLGINNTVQFQEHI